MNEGKKKDLALSIGLMPPYGWTQEKSLCKYVVEVSEAIALEIAEIGSLAKVYISPQGLPPMPTINNLVGNAHSLVLQAIAQECKPDLSADNKAKRSATTS